MSEELAKLYLDTNKPADVMSQCALMWDWSTGFPFPKWEMKCGSCGGTRHVVKNFKFHGKPDSPNKHRCLIRFKCADCSQVTFYGPVVPKELGERHPERYEYTHRDLRKIFGFE